MANTIFSGIMEALPEAIKGQQESALKQRLLAMQMLQYQAQAQKAQQKQEAIRQQQEIGNQYLATENPKARQQLLTKGALAKGDYALVNKMSAETGMSLEQSLDILEKRGLITPGAGQGSQGGPGGYDVGLSIGPKGGVTTKLDARKPTSRTQEIAEILAELGIDPSNQAARNVARQALLATGEVQHQLLNDLQTQFSGGQRQPSPQPQAPQTSGMQIMGPDGQPMYVDTPETLQEMQSRGLIEQGKYIPQPSSPQRSVASGGSPYDIIRQKEEASAIRRQAEGARQAEQATTVGQEERNTLDSLQESVNLIDSMIKNPVTSATGPMQGSSTARWIGRKAPQGMGGNRPAETKYLLHMEELENVIGLARGGKTFTPQEQARLEAILPTSDMSDTEISQRLTAIRGIFQGALERQIRMATEPRGTLRQSLQEQKQAIGGQIDAWDAVPEGKLVKDDKTGGYFRKINGKKVPTQGPR